MIFESDALAEQDQRRAILAAAENAMLVIRECGTIELANSAAERLLGYEPHSLHGRPVEILECSGIASMVDSLLDPSRSIDPLGVAAGRTALTARCADGTAIAVRLLSRPLPSRHGRFILITLARAEDARSEERPVVLPLRTDDDASLADGNRWRYDTLRHTLTCSAEIAAIFGRGPSEPLTVEAAVAAFTAVDRARVRSLFTRAITDGIAYRDQARIVRPDGGERAVVYGGTPERSDDGTVVAVSGFLRDITERHVAERERQRLSEFVMLANQSGKIGIWELDLDTNRSVWDRNMFALYGIDDVTTAPTFEMWSALLHPHDREHAIRQVSRDIADGAPSDTEFRIIWPNGQIHFIRSIASIVHDAAGRPTRIIGTDWDVSELRLLGAQLREEKEALIRSEARYRALTEALPQMVVVIDSAAQFEYVNRRWCEYTGMSLESSRRTGLAALVDPADAARVAANSAAPALTDAEYEARLRRADGTYRWHLIRSVPFADATGDAGKCILTATDIEERKSADKKLAATVAELEHIAHHDPMTDLPNRMLLMERLTQAIQLANRSQRSVIVLYVDLDRFKAVNDTLGHAAGDVVLKETGARIVATLRAGDTASRVGGDEFIVVCATNGPGDDVSHLASRLIAAVTAPIKVAGEHVIVEASVGISVYPADGFDAETLIRKADAAMYSAKQGGRNTFRRYSSEVYVSIVAATEREAELRHAIAAGELVVHYQPIIDLRTGRPRAAEALVRWQHPQRGLLPPGEFIAFAEERGLIAHVGDVVLQAACEMIERLRLLGRPEIRVGVNVSAHQFGKAGFVDGVVAALARHDTDPGRLTIEITESVVMANTRATIETLARLEALGVALSIDDFGTGYSSLAYIKNFPITTLKIDRTFIRDIAEDKTDQAIAKTIITLAHSLEMRVVAEGVESEEQLAMLKAFDVDSVQGFLFSRALPADEFERFIQTMPLPDVAQLHPGERPAGLQPRRKRRKAAG